MKYHLFTWLGHFVAAHSKKIVGIGIVLSLLSGLYAGTALQFNADLDDLVSEKLDYHRRYKDFLREFGDQEYLYAVIQVNGDLPRAKAFVRALVKRLSLLPSLREVTWQVTNPLLEKSFLLYLTKEQLEALAAMTTEGPFAVDRIARWDSLVPLFTGLAEEVRSPIKQEKESVLATSFTFLNELVDGMIGALVAQKPYVSHLQQLFFGNGETFDPEGFLRNGDLLFVQIMPAKDFTTMEVIAEPLAEIRRAISETKLEFPEMVAGLTGRPALASDEMATTNSDSTSATLLAVLLVGLLFIFFFRNVSRPLLAMVALSMGIAWTFGVVTLFIGELTILSIVFALILVGSTMDYAIQLVARYQEELATGKEVPHAMEWALATAGSSNLTTAMTTTAAAFLTIMWTDFTALAELGGIAAVGTMLCMTSMMVVLPAMIILVDQRRSPKRRCSVHPFQMPKFPRLYRYRGLLLVGGIILTALSLPLAMQVRFDNNLLDLQAKGLESVAFERLIIEKSTETTWFANAIAHSIEESHTKALAFRRLPSVRRVDDLSRIVPEDQPEKLAQIQKLAPRFLTLRFQEPKAKVDGAALSHAVALLAAGLLPLENEAFTAGRIDAVRELETFSEKLNQLQTLLKDSDEVVRERLAQFQRGFVNDLHNQLEILKSGMEPQEIRLTDLPAEMIRRFVSPSGKYALSLYPRDDIWDPAALATFVTDLRRVDPTVLGTPLEVHESGRLMRTTFIRSALLAFLIILILVWFDFRSIRATLVAVSPLVIGNIWLAGFMGLCGVSLNMANFFAIPILIGVGVDNGVHLLHRIQHDRSLHAMGTSTGRGVLLAALINAVGFGTMMISTHRGFASLGLIMAVGALCCLTAGFFIMPPIASYLLGIPVTKKNDVRSDKRV